MDKISLSGIQFYGYHGVLPEETELGTRFSVDVDLFLDLRKAGKTDELSKTVDYMAVYQTVVKIGTKTRFRLLESVAEMMADEILSRFRVSSVVITLRKLSPPIPGVLDHVSVTIKRDRS